MAEYINRERARFEAKRYFKNMDEIQEDLDMLFCMLPAENVAPVQEWISVKDRLPKIGEGVLVYSSSMGVVVDYYDIGIFEYCDITHWMPLPKPPKGE